MITIEEFKKFFHRDFPFLPNSYDNADDYVMDCDIERAIGEMEVLLPAHLFEEKALTLAELYLTAHLLIGNIRMSNSGLANNYTFPLASRSVGSVSESYSIPQSYLNSGQYSLYITSEFGLKYLAMLYPRTRGNICVVGGWTTP